MIATISAPPAPRGEPESAASRPRAGIASGATLPARVSAPARPPAEGRLSEAEERFERRRRSLGLPLGPTLFALLLAFPPEALAPPAARLLAVVGWVLAWWVTEAVPLPATALLGPALAVLLGVVPAKEAFAPFGDPIIFLFLGSFLLAGAMAAHGLDRRLARALLSARAPKLSSAAAWVA